MEHEFLMNNRKSTNEILSGTYVTVSNFNNINFFHPKEKKSSVTLKNTYLLKQLGVFIRGKRRLLDITQEKLAKICGLHINYINGIERGVRNPSLTTLIVLSKALGFSFDELLASLDLKNIYICKPNL